MTRSRSSRNVAAQSGHDGPSMRAKKYGVVKKVINKKMKKRLVYTEGTRNDLQRYTLRSPASLTIKKSKPQKAIKDRKVQVARILDSVNINNNAVLLTSKSKSKMDKEHKARIVGMKPPKCDCLPKGVVEEYSGPYYDYLATAKSPQDMRKIFEERTGLTGPAIRIEKTKYLPLGGVGKSGCPIAKYVSFDGQSGSKMKIVFAFFYLHLYRRLMKDDNFCS